jgi:hypothetical protein
MPAADLIASILSAIMLGYQYREFKRQASATLK